MLKLLIVGVAIALLLWLLFGAVRRGKGVPRAEDGRGKDGVEAMVGCAHCGVLLPRSEALAARGLHYCSALHRDGDDSASV